VRVFHLGAGTYDSLESADLLLAHATFLGKYSGFMPGMVARLASIFGPLVKLKLGQLRYTLSGQKIDGSQG
jgi:hypothetical protein